jgi:hypothetical protein
MPGGRRKENEKYLKRILPFLKSMAEEQNGGEPWLVF